MAGIAGYLITPAAVLWLVALLAAASACTMRAIDAREIAQRARAGGVAIGFWTYFKVGAPLTMLTILFGAWWL